MSCEDSTKWSDAKELAFIEHLGRTPNPKLRRAKLVNYVRAACRRGVWWPKADPQKCIVRALELIHQQSFSTMVERFLETSKSP